MRHNSRASGRPNDGAANLAMLKRTVKKLFSYYPVLAPVTFACILFSAIVSSIPSLFVQNVIQIIQKWYVSRDWASAKAELVPILSLLISLYVLSIIAILVYKQLMAYMTQGFLDKLRQEMFGGMQDLPIRYFDTHQHGDIMSFYTNDIDTLRQLVSEAIPAFLQSGAIVLAVFAIMLYFSLWLTLVLILGIVLMISVTKRVGGGSAKFFLRQQKAVAKTEGFIQETMTGQKVVKVFCHEQRSIEEFDKLNNALYEDSYRANAYASVLGPIIGNIGNLLYVGLALVGGVFLLIRKVISWHTPVAFIATVAVLCLISAPADVGITAVQYMAYNVFGGGLMLGAIFMATDYATSPVTKPGQLIFGLGCGLLTCFIRRFGSYPEGVCYSILIMNCTTWLLDKYIRPVIYGAPKKEKKEAAK